jgi:8-oxo-dGTP pyrophosphatase MutT (NUDIX family)
VPVQRISARVLLLDPDGRVLLFRGHFPETPDEPFWFTVGGGVDPGEELADAALREVAEETGIVLDREQLEGPVWRRLTEYVFGGEPWEGDEWFFRARLDAPAAVDTSGFTQLETDTVETYRWWPLDELRATSERVYPAGMADLLEKPFDGSTIVLDERV